MRPTRRLATLAAVATLTTGVAVAVTASTSAADPRGAEAPQGTASAASASRLDRVFIIMIENHGLHSVIGDPAAPYITSLSRTYGKARRYYGVTHPSLPNYVAAISGSNWDVNSDDPTLRFAHTNVVDQLEAAGHSWAAYMDAMPTAGYLGSYWPNEANPLYANKHNPFILMTDIRSNPARRAHIKPYGALAHDLNSTSAPQYVWIGPDQCHDMHGGVYGTVAGHPETPCPYGNSKGDAADQALKRKADRFVEHAVTTIMRSQAWTKRSAIFLVSDEGDYTGVEKNGGWESPAGCCDSPYLPAGDPRVSPAWPGGTYGGALIPAVVVTGAGPRHVVDDTAYNHYSLLRTVEDAFGLSHLVFASDSQQVHSMTDLVTP